MNAVKVKDDIYWVGAVDYNVRNFHGYTTNNGATYNAYLIIDEKVTLIDTVKREFADEMWERIKTVIDPNKIDYIITNHVEMDHSGALPVLMERLPNAKIFTTDPAGINGLTAHYGPYDYHGVKTDDVLNIGKRNLKFVSTAMLHWPDNMVTYCPEEEILFSNDAFGQHLATVERFDYEVDKDLMYREAKKYFCNILMPFRKQAYHATKLVEEINPKIIAPSHGLILTEEVSNMLKHYEEWSTTNGSKKAIVVYDSMWHSTEKMALNINEAFYELGYDSKIYDLKVWHPSEVITEVLDAEYIAVGSSCLNNQILPNVAGFLCYLKGLSPKNRKAFGFGSYGWTQAPLNELTTELKKCDFEVITDPLMQNYIPTEEDLKNLKDKVKSLVK